MHQFNRVQTPILWLTILMVGGVLSACSYFEVAHRVDAAQQVLTSSGIAHGRSVVIGESEIIEWLDIPYAQPPVAELRWRAPRPLAASDDLIVAPDTTACVQEASDYGGVAGRGMVGSEDCLYLDIRAPSTATSERRPVMFWIHGGANVSGVKDYYDFSRLVASEDVVVVTINYRLGPLGWFTHPAIQGLQEGIDRASNYGTLDMIEALKWVQKNIASFGGDPKNVTIFGESAGGHNVLALLASPLSSGLYHRAIAQSGYLTSATVDSAINRDGVDPLVRRGSWQMVDALLLASGERSDAPPQENWSLPALRDKLISIDAREFFQVYIDNAKNDYMPLTTADGVVIPVEGLRAALGDSTYAKRVPVIAGSNRDELTLWLGLHRYFMSVSYPFTRLLPPVVRVKNPELYQFWVETRSHAWKLRGVDDALDALHKAGYDNLYAYRFDWDDQQASWFADFPAFMGASHGIEIAFLTGDYKYGPISDYIYPPSIARDQMEATMMSVWADFARSSNPAMRLSNNWLQYTQNQRYFLRLDKDLDLGLESERDDMDSLLLKIANTEVASELEKCIIAWESLINVGDPEIARYQAWDDRRCANYDIVYEQQRIADELREAHGSVAIF